MDNNFAIKRNKESRLSCSQLPADRDRRVVPTWAAASLQANIFWLSTRSVVPAPPQISSQHLHNDSELLPCSQKYRRNTFLSLNFRRLQPRNIFYWRFDNACCFPRDQAKVINRESNGLKKWYISEGNKTSPWTKTRCSINFLTSMTDLFAAMSAENESYQDHSKEINKCCCRNVNRTDLKVNSSNVYSLLHFNLRVYSKPFLGLTK